MSILVTVLRVCHGCTVPDTRIPERATNYWKSYPLDKFSDAAVASEILTILYDVYGYAGATKLKISTE